jgi:hypothetical protein
VTCVPGELLNHHQQCPAHADGSFGGQIDGVVETEPGGDVARSCAGAIELVDDAGQGLVIIDGEGPYIASSVTVAVSSMSAQCLWNQMRSTAAACLMSEIGVVRDGTRRACGLRIRQGRGPCRSALVGCGRALRR